MGEMSRERGEGQQLWSDLVSGQTRQHPGASTENTKHPLLLATWSVPAVVDLGGGLWSHRLFVREIYPSVPRMPAVPGWRSCFVLLCICQASNGTAIADPICAALVYVKAESA